MKFFALLLLIIVSGFYTHAQKIKYKELYVLLRAKNYKDASSFLVRYLAENPEHPNANYQMGLMLEFKIADLDLLKESEAIISRADSSIQYFDKAYAYITPKEVKKHDDDYYELFKRRNLRTGKFEVILSDVQLDIENRKASLQQKKVDIILINSKFDMTINFYKQARSHYRDLRDAYIDELSLAMGAVDTTLSSIENLMWEYDSALTNFKEYKKLKKSFESSSSELIIFNNSVENFAKEALKKPDFYAKKVTLYNFKEWGANQLENIKEQRVLIDHLIEFDASLDNLANKIIEDSVDLSSEVFRKITLPVLKNLKKLDPESLMIDIFQYKISQLNYSSILMTWFGQYEDTLNVGLQLEFVVKLKDQLEGVSRLEANLHEYDESIFMLRYHRLSEERYASKEELFKYINSQAALIANQTEAIDSIFSSIEERDKWGYWNKDTVSIALQSDPLAKYNTFYTDSLENRSIRIAGLTKMEGKQVFFFGNIPSSRIIDSLYFADAQIESIDINSTEFVIESSVPTPDQMIYLIGIPREDKYQLQLIYLHKVNGIIWNNPIELTNILSPQLSYTNDYIEITQGDSITMYQFSDGLKIEEDGGEEQPEEKVIDGEGNGEG